MADIKICEMTKSQVNPTDSDLFVMDRLVSSSESPLYITNSLDGEQLKNYVFSGNTNRISEFGTLKTSIDATANSGGTIRSVFVRTLDNSDDSSNAASTKWVGTFWSRQLTSANTIDGKWTHTDDLKLQNLNENCVAVLDGNRVLTSSSITTTKLGYLSDVTGNIGALLNNKAPSNNPSFTGSITTPLSGDRVVVTDSSKRLKHSQITTTELESLSGILTTKTIQAQLNEKATNANLNLKADDSSVVHKSGEEEEITGIKKIKDVDLYFKSSTFDSTSTTSGNYRNFVLLDSRNKNAGYVAFGGTKDAFGVHLATTDTNGAWLGSLSVVNYNGTFYATSETPDANADDKRIATTAWVNSKLDNMIETWTFTLTNGTTYTKKVVVKS